MTRLQMKMQMKKREFLIDARDWVLKITGQNTLITEYNTGIMALCRASDAEKDPQRKDEILHQIKTIEEEKMFEDEHGAMGCTTFNPYKPFQKKILQQKNAALNKVLRQFGLNR